VDVNFSIMWENLLCVQTVVIRSMERNVVNIYEARRLLLTAAAGAGIIDTNVTSVIPAADNTFSSVPAATVPVYSRPPG